MLAAGGDERLWLGRGICASAISPMMLQPACRLFQAVWAREPPDGVLQHTIYTDGSAIHADMPAACRAVWGSAMIGPADTVVACAHGPLPLFTQSSGCAEIFAATAIALSCPPIELVTDYEQLVEGWQQGLGAYTHPGAKSGEAWKHFWRIAADFGLDHIRVRKVPAHKPFLAVSQGLITFVDWLGNRKADEMAKLGVNGHQSNKALVREERARTAKQGLVGNYLAWLNVQLRQNDMRLVWQSDIVTDMAPMVQETLEGHAQRGLSRDLRAHGTEAYAHTPVVDEAGRAACVKWCASQVYQSRGRVFHKTQT